MCFDGLRMRHSSELRSRTIASAACRCNRWRIHSSFPKKSAKDYRLMTTITRAVDAHAHVFGGPEFPFSPHTLYTPEPSQMGTAEKFRAVLAAHGRTHGLLVGAGPYEYDN